MFKNTPPPKKKSPSQYFLMFKPNATMITNTMTADDATMNVKPILEAFKIMNRARKSRVYIP